MNKLLKFSSIALCAFLTLGAASCSDNDEPDSPQQVLSEGDQLLQKALKVNVENTINETYKDLADSTSQLYDQMVLLRKASAQNAVTQEMVDKACKLFLGARANYELSEAFLLGAAAADDDERTCCRVDRREHRGEGVHAPVLGAALQGAEVEPVPLGASRCACDKAHGVGRTGTFGTEH